MGAVNVVLGVVTAVLTVVAVVLVARTVARMVSVVRLGQPDGSRTGPFGPRLRTMLVETLGHTRMLKWSHVGVFHWLIMVGFGGLFLALVEAYGEVWNPAFHLPLIGLWGPYSLLVELLGIGTVLGIAVLAVYRQVNNPRRTGRASRFYGSHMGRAYFVEAVVFVEGAGILLVRAAKSAIGAFDVPTWSAPVSIALGTLLPPAPVLVSVFATLKIASAMVWLIVIALTPTMGVAWHRFTAFPNIYFKRGSLRGPGDGGKALGALRPMMSGGRVLDLEEADPETDTFGAGRVEDFTWKGVLDFTTCTECGRCQSQCPAWNTGKPLSPKLLITALRDHAYAKAPYLLAGGSRDMTGEEVGLVGEGAGTTLAAIPVDALREAERPLVGPAGADGELGGVIDPDILWSCTTCGACVEQCPVDIEHVDHVVDLRRYQVMIETEFPSELGTLFRNLENKGNPWGQSARNRLDWTKNLPFDVPVFDGELTDDHEYLFWVGCAGAFDDKAQKTVRAVAELLHRAEVGYVVLGPDETCTGDPARRSGNEFLFQMMAAGTKELLDGVFEGRGPGTRKIVTTCPHCFNTLGREYPQLSQDGDLGGHYEVVHHTQLLNTLVRNGKLVPVADAAAGQDVTYHDPCYLGRHNEVYAEPRALVGAAGATLAEMPRHADRSFCCGAGGARMWMEERIGRRINLERVDEALGTGAAKIATGCPFCRVMLSDGLTQRQSEDQGTDVEILDVAQLLLASVKRGDVPGGKVDALGAGSPNGTATVPLSGTQVSGKGPASAVTSDADGDVSVGGGQPGGASTTGAHPDATPPPGEHPGGG